MLCTCCPCAAEQCLTRVMKNQDILSTALTFFLSVLLFLYLYCQYKYSYWKRRKVTYEVPETPFGCLRNVILRREHLMQFHCKIYNTFSNERYVGFYNLLWPQLLIKDMSIIKAVLTNNEDFSRRGMLINKDPFTQSILSLDNHDRKFKGIRGKLNEATTTGKVRMYMFDTMLKYSDELINYLHSNYCVKDESFDLRDVMSKYALDVFGAAILGIKCESFSEGFNPYQAISRETFAPKPYLAYIKVILSLLAPEFVKLVRWDFCRVEVKQFYAYVWEQMRINRSENAEQRNALVDGFMELVDGNEKDGKSSEYKFTHQDIVASLIPTSAAGYESSASMLSFAFYQLALNQHIQDKARIEVTETVKSHGGFTYEAILDMKYIEAIIDETLRMYPAIPLLLRQNNKKCKLPNTDLVLEEGTKLVIPLCPLLRDPEIFPEPNKFNPDRILTDIAKVAISLPFGLGTRICPGKRYSLIEGRVAIAKVLSKYRILPAPNTPKEIIADPNSISYLSKEPTWAQLEELQSKQL